MGFNLRGFSDFAKKIYWISVVAQMTMIGTIQRIRLAEQWPQIHSELSVKNVLMCHYTTEMV